jgi:membrane fusion protein, copper/silver efflux system
MNRQFLQGSSGANPMTVALRFGAVTIGLCGALACSKAAQPDSSPSLVPTAAAGQKPAEPAADKGAVAVLNAYEGLRSALAADDLSGAQAAAKQLATVATEAGKGTSTALVAGLKAIADAATVEAALAHTDATAVRKQFGEVSKHLVALVTSDAKLQQGRYVFECPMAPGYGKWIQTDTQVSNPYMGKRMLTCGSKSTW